MQHTFNNEESNITYDLGPNMNKKEQSMRREFVVLAGTLIVIKLLKKQFASSNFINMKGFDAWRVGVLPLD
jgi:hypothetical protein